jgi:hypothetical protein
MRRVLPLLLAACGSGGTDPAAPDGAPSPDAADVDAAPDAPAGFGTLSGMCGVLMTTDLTSTSPSIVRDTFTFDRAFVDPDDRPLLTPGGKHLAETPNAGGSSGLSEVFAYEQLARCEEAGFYKTETEIVYDTVGKITDLEVTIDGHKIGVSVTRAVAFPFGDPYTMDAANALLTKKLEGIAESTMNVSAGDRWDKQFLAVMAWDDQAADTIVQSWNGLDASLQADTILIVTSTAGEDLFIYSNN